MTSAMMNPVSLSLMCSRLESCTFVGVFCTNEIYGGQDRAFQFHGGLANNKAHSDLSWFKLLLGGNSPTSNGLILKMNMCYKM
jgi:hypothetical protein